MTLACHHAPRMTGSAERPKCTNCNAVLGRARCEACNGRGRLFLVGHRPQMCLVCEGRGYNWVELRTFVVTSPNREGQP